MLLLALVCSCASPNSDEGGVDASSSSTTDDPSTESGTAETETEDQAHERGEPDGAYMPADAEVSYQNGAEEMVALQVFAGPAPAAKYDAWTPVE